MCDTFRFKLEQTTHALGVLAYNQQLLINNTTDDGSFLFREFHKGKIVQYKLLDLIALLKRYAEQTKVSKQLESQLKSVTLKTKSQR